MNFDWLFNVGDECNIINTPCMSAGVKYIVPAFIDLRSSGFDFVMSKHLITNRSYKDFVDNSKVKFAYSHDARFNHDNKPVVGVRYDHAIKYCEWLSVILGKDVRLPTIEEWEGVAKYGQEKIYHILWFVR